MRIMFAAATGLGLAAALAAAPAPAQQITFPAPVFHGGDIDWEVTLASNKSTVGYALSGPPKAANPAKGSLTFVSASGFDAYWLTGKIGTGQAESRLTVVLTPNELGEQCKDKAGKADGKYGRYSHTVTITPAKPTPWPTNWTGCGVFTQN